MSLGRFDAEIQRSTIESLQRLITELKLENADLRASLERAGDENNELCDRLYELTQPAAAE